MDLAPALFGGFFAQEGFNKQVGFTDKGAMFGQDAHRDVAEVIRIGPRFNCCRVNLHVGPELSNTLRHEGEGVKEVQPRFPHHMPRLRVVEVQEGGHPSVLVTSRVRRARSAAQRQHPLTECPLFRGKVKCFPAHSVCMIKSGGGFAYAENNSTLNP